MKFMFTLQFFPCFTMCISSYQHIYFSLSPHFPELNEFVIQLDEEVDSLMTFVLSLQQQLQDSRDSTAAAATPLTPVSTATPVTKATGNHGNSGSSSKERTSSRHNGPLETAHVVATAISSSSGKSSSSRSSNS